MNAVLLIAHAPLAHALRECALHVFADAGDDIGALDVDAHEPPEQTLARAQALRARWGERPVLVLTDVLGATPCNVAQRLADGERTQLLAGVNLPMLLRAITYRAEPLAAMAQRALDGGVRGVVAVAPAVATEPALKGAA
ncbi:MAG: PTS fructose transporter subunit IIA [Burkholderiales bacterium 68-10]|nr:MAG: PTS fructose transporter subunit IIA [Burkholderiales bacterium 68-10]